jgi:hypothetical protein
MEKHIEVVTHGQTKTVLVVFYEPELNNENEIGTELRFSAHVWLKDRHEWWFAEGIPALSREDAFDFFHSVAVAWGGDRPICYVYALRLTKPGY